MTQDGGAASPRTDLADALEHWVPQHTSACAGQDDDAECICGTSEVYRAALRAAQEAQAPEGRPTHHWNDPDGDGHDCADCASDSMWKCDATAHVPGHARYPDPACPVCVERHATAILDSLPAQEAQAPEGLIERISTILDNARLAVVIEVGRAVVLDFGQAEAPAPEGLRAALERLVDSIPTAADVDALWDAEDDEPIRWQAEAGEALEDLRNALAARLSAGGATKP